MTVGLEMFRRFAILVRVDCLNAVLEMATRVQAAGGDLNELAQDIKGALGFEMDAAANDRIRIWQTIILPR
jgi:hypothetical protein